MRAPSHWLFRLIVALTCAQPSEAEAKAARPDPLADEAGCDRYRGVPIGANDPTQQFELVVCPTAEGVRGKVQTSSLVSGWSVRRSVGSWDPSGRVLTLADTEFLESRPEPGWQFCLIDELVLERTDEGLEGRYVSRACDDRAELVLEKLEPVAVEPAAPAPANPSEVPAPAKQPPEVDDEPQPQPRGCSCELDEPTRPGGLALLGVVIVSLVRRRRA